MYISAKIKHKDSSLYFHDMHANKYYMCKQNDDILRTFFAWCQKKIYMHYDI